MKNIQRNIQIYKELIIINKSSQNMFFESFMPLSHILLNQIINKKNLYA